MDETKELTAIQKLRQEIQKSCPALPDYKIVQMCEDYGIIYNMPDSSTLRIFMLLASAEEKLLKNLPEESQ